MALYRKLPVTIEAEEFLGFDEHFQKGSILDQVNIKRESLAIIHCKKCDEPFSKHGRVITSDNDYIVCPGDMIVKGTDGVFFSYNKKSFNKKYEEV